MSIPDSVTLNYPSGPVTFYRPDASVPVVAARIVSPSRNRVFQRAASGVTLVTVAWEGSADVVRIKKGGLQVAETLDGRANLAPGWYEACLVSGGVEGDCVPFGVGDVYVVAGQSNGVSPLQPATFVPAPVAPGRVILSRYYGPANSTATRIDAFRDPATEPLVGGYQAGVAWLYAGLEMNRPHPVMFVIVARGNSTAADWANSHVSDLFRVWAEYRPRAILWHQGESECTTPPRTDSYAMLNSVVESLRQVSITPWVIALNSTSYAPPAGLSEWPVRQAQRDVIARWPHVHQGPDTDPIRTPGEVEFLGPALEQHGRLWGARLNALNL